MKRMIIQYRVKPEQAAENQRYIEAVFAELRANAPAGIRYIAFKGGDGLTFMHLVSIETESGESPLDQSPAFQAFSSTVNDRVEAPPTFTMLDEVGSYRVFGA